MKKNGPKYLFSKKPDNWEKVSEQLRCASKIALFLDYDGTLTPIRKKPSAAILPPETKRLLERLAVLTDVSVSIVTGRSMENIIKTIPVENITFIANHGFHIVRGKNEWIHPKASSIIQTLSELSTALKQSYMKFPEGYIENKNFTLSIHFRNLPGRKVSSFKSFVNRTVRDFDRNVVVTKGKKVLEVRPRSDWGKGSAVLQVLKQNGRLKNSLPLFIGDDTTDEDVFKKLRRKGITIRVGMNNATDAVYYVRTVDEVLLLIRFLIAFRTDLFSRNSRKRK